MKQNLLNAIRYNIKFRLKRLIKKYVIIYKHFIGLGCFFILLYYVQIQVT